MGAVIEAQDQLLQFLSSKGVVCPAPQSTLTGAYIVQIDIPMTGDPQQTRMIATRLLGWVHGAPMNCVATNKVLVERAGAFFGTLSLYLDEFDHSGAHRVHQWDLSRMDEIEGLINALHEQSQRDLVFGVIEEFKRIKPKLSKLRHGVLQADFNDANIIVQKDTVSGVIDFGDIVYSARINDVAIAIAYMMLTAFGRKHPIEAGCAFLSGFCKHYTLLPQELEILYTLICGRLAVSATIGAYSYLQQPENEYLLLHAKPAWDMLRFLRNPSTDVSSITKQFQLASGI